MNFLRFPIAGETSFNQSVTLGVNVDPGETPEGRARLVVQPSDS